MSSTLEQNIIPKPINQKKQKKKSNFDKEKSAKNSGLGKEEVRNPQGLNANFGGNFQQERLGNSDDYGLAYQTQEAYYQSR